MSTEAKEVKLNRAAASAIVAAITKGLKEVGGTGSLLHSCVTVARSHWKGKPIPAGDVKYTLDTLAEAQNWKGRTADIRRSEYKAVIENYAKLPEAMSEYKNKAGHCSWHDGIALARLLRTKAPSAAASAHFSNRKSKGKDPSKITKVDAIKTVAKFVKRMRKMTALPKDFRDGLAELCTEHGIKV